MKTTNNYDDLAHKRRYFLCSNRHSRSHAVYDVISRRLRPIMIVVIAILWCVQMTRRPPQLFWLHGTSMCLPPQLFLLLRKLIGTLQEHLSIKLPTWKSGASIIWCDPYVGISNKSFTRLTFTTYTRLYVTWFHACHLIVALLMYARKVTTSEYNLQEKWINGWDEISF
jgi:hypothetical protein